MLYVQIMTYFVVEGVKDIHKEISMYKILTLKLLDTGHLSSSPPLPLSSYHLPTHHHS
jgi:hypothetical protein